MGLLVAVVSVDSVESQIRGSGDAFEQELSLVEEKEEDELIYEEDHLPYEEGDLLEIDEDSPFFYEDHDGYAADVIDDEEDLLLEDYLRGRLLRGGKGGR